MFNVSCEWLFVSWELRKNDNRIVLTAMAKDQFLIFQIKIQTDLTAAELRYFYNTCAFEKLIFYRYNKEYLQFLLLSDKMENRQVKSMFFFTLPSPYGLSLHP